MAASESVAPTSTKLEADLLSTLSTISKMSRPNK